MGIKVARSAAAVDALSATGVSVIIASTDTDDLVRAVDRVCVFRNGSIHGIVTGPDITTENRHGLSQGSL